MDAALPKFEKKWNVGSGETKITSQGLINYRFWLFHTELRLKHIAKQVDWILLVHDKCQSKSWLKLWYK